MITVGVVSDGLLYAVTAETEAQAVHELAEAFGNGVVDTLADFRAGHMAPHVPAPERAPESVPRGDPGKSAGGAADDSAPSPASEDVEEGTPSPPPGGKAACAVCGTGVPSGRAEASRDDYGEVRCKKCSG